MRTEDTSVNRFTSVLLSALMVTSLAVLLLTFSSSSTTVSASSSLGWWDTNWQYRRLITITNTGNLLENYQVKIDIINYDNGMLPNFDDLRFVDNDNVTMLSYWIENCNLDENAIVWVNIPSLPASGSKTIYMYYGNPSASSTSNGNTTFMFFDDFNGATLDNSKWTAYKEGSTDAIVRIEDGALHLAGKPNTVASGSVESVPSFTDNIAIRIKRELPNGVNYMDVSLGSGTIRSEDGGSSNWWNTTLGSGYLWEIQNDADARTYIMPATGEDIQIGTKWAPGTGAIQNYHINEFVVSDEASSNIKWLEPGGLVYPTNPLRLPNYGASGLLHPDVLYFANGMDGYKYWMVYTPYPPDPLELPTILRSNDGVNWTSTGISNPVIPLGQSGDWNDQNNADPDFIYVENYHEWFMVHAGGHGGYYRVGLEYSNGGKTWYDAQQTTFNGKNAPIIIENGNAQQPTLLYENGIFNVFYSSELYGNNRSPLCHATFNWNDNLKKAENITEDPNNPLVLFPADTTFESGAGHWDISKKDNTYYLYHVRYLAGSSAEGLALATSDNYENWPTTSVLVLAPSPGGWDSSQIYRSAPVVDNSGEIVLFDNEVKLYYSAYGSPGIGMAHGDGTQFTKGVIPSPIALEEAVDDIATNSTWLTNNKNILISQGSYTSSGSYGDQYVDWVLVRKYVSTKPTWVMGGKETVSVSALISPSSQNGSNGSTLNYTVTVTNTENFSDNFNLTVSDNCNWLPTVSQASLVVAPSSSDNTTTLSVTIPENAIGGTIDYITVTATSQTDNTVSTSASCTAQVIARNVSVSISPSGNSGANGATLTYAVTINNTGNVSDNYTISATDNSGWSPSLSKPSIVVAPGSSDNTTTLSVTIPSSSVAGTIDHITVTATSQTDNTVSASASCTAQAVASYWLYMKKIVIDHSKVSENLTNFPVLIDITDNDLKSHAQSNGYDIVFRDNFLTKLNHQIELYDNATGHLVAWVNVPALSSMDNTILFMYYGNPTCSDQENVGGTWNDNFVLVQHLNEKSGTHYDSTSNHNNGTPDNGVTQGVVGKIDGADSFDGINDYLDCGNGSSLNLSSKITVEGWVFLGAVSRWQGLVCKGTTNGWTVVATSTNELDFADIKVNDYKSSGANITSNSWIFITVTFDSSLPSANIKFYKNGLFISQQPKTSPYPINSVDLIIGTDMDSEHINGIVDEVRISNVARSAGWISAEFKNEDSPNTFYSIGSEETSVVKYQVRFDQIGIDNTATGTVLTVNGLSLTRDNLPYTISVDNGTVENYSYSSMVSSSVVGKQFSENDVTGKPSPITVNGPENITGNYVTQYKLTMTTNLGETSPSVGDTWDNAGLVVNISATPPSAGAGENYLFSGWIGTGTDNYTGPDQFTSVTMNGPITETASWTHRYYLTVTSPHGTTGGDGWYDNGATAYATVTPLTVSGPAGVQYVFTNWSADATGTTSPSDPITMDSPKTATAVWKTQYYLTVTSSQGTTGGAGWYDNGETAYATVTPLTVPGTTGVQYVFTNWSGDATGTTSPSDSITMDAPKTATADWKTQYYLTVTSTHDTPGGEAWYDSGSTANATLASGTDSGGAGTQYVFTNWSGDASGTGLTSDNILMNAPKTAIANWQTQYLVHYMATGNVLSVTVPDDEWVNAGGVATGVFPLQVTDTGIRCNFVSDDRPSAINGPTTVTGNYQTQYYLTVSSPHGTTGGDGWYDSGATANATVTPLTVSGSPGVHYVFTNWSGDASGTTSPSNDIMMDGPKTAIAVWKTQYYLTVTSSYGSPTGAGWYDNGSSADFGVTTPVSGGAGTRYVFTGWSSSDSGGYTGSSASYSVTMNNPITETASWKTQYYLTLMTSPSVGATLIGQDWYDSGASAAISTDNIVAIDSGSRYRFIGWTTDNMDEIADASSTSTTVKMDSAKTVTAQYVMQYYLTVTSPHGTTGGAGWYDNGATAYATVTPLIVPGTTGVQYVFTSWSVDASGTTSPSDPITMDAPKTATVVWKTQYYLTVLTSPLSVNSPTGEGWYDSGASAAISTDNIVPIDSDSKYRFNGWTTDNKDEIASPSSTSTTVIIDMAKTITANYVTQYLLTMDTNFGTTSPSAGVYWFDAGTVLTISATAPSAGAGERYVWNGWTGSGPGSYTGTDNPATDEVTMSGPIIESASWIHQYKLTMDTNFGATSPSAGDTWENAGLVVDISTTPPSAVVGENYVFNGWTGTGTVSYTGANQSSSVTMNGPITEGASWTHRYRLTMDTNFGTTTPSAGNIWENVGSVVNISATSPSAGPGEQYVWNGWTGTGTGSYTGSAQSPSITMSGPITETASWTYQVWGVDVSISPSSQSGLNGATLIYTVIIFNTGNVSDNYSLTVSDNYSWGPTVSPTSLVIPAFSSGTVTLGVTIPSNATGGTIDNIRVKATSQTENTVSDSDSCTGQAKIFSVTLKLVAGWNLVSFSVDNENTTPARIFTGLTYSENYWIFYWVAPWGPYKLQGPDQVLNDNMGYWVWIDRADNIVISGARPVSRDINLVTGWNLVGFPVVNENTTPARVFTGLTYSENYWIFYWVAPWGPYKLQGPDQVLNDNMGYWVWIDHEKRVTVP